MRSPNRRHDLPFLYKYTSAETAKSILRTRSLRWSSPRLFNDPFDVPRDLGLPFTTDELRAAVVARVKQYIFCEAVPKSQAAFVLIAEIAERDPSQHPLLIDTLHDTLHLTRIPMEIAMEGFRSAWLEKINHLRIVCFSAVADSPTMWAHYADNHKGVILQFESSDERDSSSLLATPVIYRQERPGLPIVDRWARAFLGEDDIDWDEYFHEYYYVKSEDWSYEKEYRAISASPNDPTLYYDSPFFAEDLRGLILGASIPMEDELELRALAALYPQMEIYRATLDPTTRRVRYVRASAK